MDRLPPPAFPAGSLSDFSQFGLPTGRDIPAHLSSSANQSLSDLKDDYKRLGPALNARDFPGRDLTRERADTLMRAASTNAVDPADLRDFLEEMRSMLAHAVKAGAEGVTKNHADHPAVIPFAQEVPTDFPAAVRERDAHLAVLAQAAPERSPTRPGHAALCRAQALLKPLQSSDVRDPDALPRWQSALAGALALEAEAIATARHPHAQPSDAIRLLMTYHGLPRAT